MSDTLQRAKTAELEKAKKEEQRAQQEEQRKKMFEELSSQPAYSIESGFSKEGERTLKRGWLENKDLSYNKFINELLYKPLQQAEEIYKANPNQETQRLLYRHKQAVESWSKFNHQVISEVAKKFDYDPEKFRKWYSEMQKTGKAPSLYEISKTPVVEITSETRQLGPVTYNTPVLRGRFEEGRQTPVTSPQAGTSGEAIPAGQFTSQEQPTQQPRQETTPARDIQKELTELQQVKQILEDRITRYENALGVSVDLGSAPIDRPPPKTAQEQLEHLKQDVDYLKRKESTLEGMYNSRAQAKQAARAPFTMHTAPDGKIDIILDDGNALRVEAFVKAKDGSWVINPYVAAILGYRQAMDVAKTQTESQLELKKFLEEYKKNVADQKQVDNKAKEFRQKYLERLNALSKEYDKFYSDLSSPHSLGTGEESILKADKDIILTMYEAGVKDEGVKAMAEALKAGKRLKPKRENGKLVFSEYGTIQYEIEGEPGKVLFRPAYLPSAVLGGES